MFYKVLNMYSIIAFDKESFTSIQDNIEKSKGYVSSIDSHKNIVKINPRYKKFLDYKQALYTFYGPRTPFRKTPNSKHMFATILSKDINQEKLKELNENYGIQEDYINEYQIISQESNGSYVALNSPKPIECVAFDNLLDMDEVLENINRTNLSKNFIMHNCKRYTLLPFLIKDGDKYMEAYVVANIYDVGIITLQITMTFEYDSVIPIPEIPPRQHSISEVLFYKTKQSYDFNDFWEKNTKKNITVDEIMNHYVDQLRKLSKAEFNENRSDRRINWVLGDFFVNKHINHTEFIDKNQKLYFSYLMNGNKQNIDRLFDDELKSTLKEAEIYKVKDCVYMCSPLFSILSLGSTSIHKNAAKKLKQHEKELKQSKMYEDQLKILYKKATLLQMYDFLRFYELSFIKKHFVRQLLQGMSNNTFKTSKEYNSLRKEFNFLKLKYDEEILFGVEGSAKKLYRDILKKTNTSSLLTKAEELFKNIREDVINQKESEVKLNETIILIISSILTIVLGYNGVKLLVNDILLNLPFLGSHVILHPLRYTVGIWSALVMVMFYLNLKRWKKHKK